MSLDFDALRKKLNTLKGQNNRSSALWKPPEGNSTIRILPWKDNADNPFVELYFHYLGNKTQLSPMTKGHPDPIAEFADKLRGTGDSDDWKYAKQFSPKLRTYVPIIVRGEEKEGVRFWGFGKTVYEAIVGVMLDEDWGDITDIEKGHDVGLEFIPQAKSDTNFAKTITLVKPKETPLSKDAELVEKWLDEQPDVYEVFQEPSYEELLSFLNKYLNPDSDESVTTEVKSPSLDEPAEVSEAKAELEKVAVAASIVDESDDDESDDDDVTEEFAKLFDN